MLDFLRKRLSVKILLALTIGAAIVMGIVIYLSLTNQREQIREQMATFGRELKYLAYAGIKHPMSVGDSPSVEKQLLDVKKIMKTAEIAICDFNQHIVFATHENLIGKPVTAMIHNQETLISLKSLLANSDFPYERYYEEEVGGKNTL